MAARKRLIWFWTATCDSRGAPQESGTRFSLVRVYTQDIPALLKTNRRLIAITAGSFILGLICGAILAVLYPGATHSLLRAYAEQVERLGGLDSITTGAILGNNLRIVLLGPLLALLTFGLYPLLVVALPGVLLGMLAVQIEVAIPLKVFVGLVLVLPHGIFEIPAIVIGSALSLRILLSLVFPVPSLSARENVAWSVMNVCKGFVFLVIPLMVIAAWTEVHVTGQIARWLTGLDWFLGMSPP